MMPRPRHSPIIEAELHRAIDAIIAEGGRPTFSNVANLAKRARGLLSSSDTTYQAPRSRILELTAHAREAASVAAASAKPPGERRLVRPRRIMPSFQEIEKRFAANSSTIAALLVALADRGVARGPQAREARLAARTSRNASNALLAIDEQASAAGS